MLAKLAGMGGTVCEVMRESLTKELGNPISWNTALKVRTIQYGL